MLLEVELAGRRFRVTIENSIITRIDLLTYAGHELRPHTPFWRNHWEIKRKKHSPGLRLGPVVDKVIAESNGKVRLGTPADLPMLRWLKAEKEAAMEREKYLQSQAI
jgi:hypothetical protein